MFKRICVFVSVCVVLSQMVHAQNTWFVDDDTCPSAGDGSNINPFCLIQDAINIASDTDEIIVAIGTYNESIDFLGKAITVRSTDPSDRATVLATIIDGTGTNAFHVVQCVNGEGPQTVLSGFTIIGGNAGGVAIPDGSGGGMYNFNSSPTVSYCTFYGNVAIFLGGGMYNDGGAPTVTNCTFDANTANGGAGMYNINADTTVTNCAFQRNVTSGVSPGGAGMQNVGGSPMISFCSFDGNSSPNGAGMFNTASTPQVSDCTFTRNDGHAMFNISSDVTVTNCEFRANSSIDNGGAMYNHQCSPMIMGCVFIENEASLDGGAMWNNIADPIVSDCTFTGNVSVGGTGGAIYNNSGLGAAVVDTTICGNLPDQIDGDPITDGGGNIISDICPPPVARIATGACCVNGNCLTLSAADCALAGGSYQGDDTDCAIVICLAACPADINGDASINVTDLLALLAAWGACP